MVYVPISKKPKAGGYTPVSKKSATEPLKQKTKLPPATTELPFDATKTGIAVNTAKGVKDWGVGVLRSIPRGIAGTLEQGEALLTGRTQDSVSITPDNKYTKFLFGEEPIEPAKEGADFLKMVGVGENAAKKFGPALFAGLTILDFIGVPGKRKALTESIKQADNIADATKVLKGAGVKDETIKALELDKKVVAAKTDEAVDAIIKETVAKEAPLPKVPKAIDEAPIPAKTIPTPTKTLPIAISDDVIKTVAKTDDISVIDSVVTKTIPSAKTLPTDEYNILLDTLKTTSNTNKVRDVLKMVEEKTSAKFADTVIDLPGKGVFARVPKEIAAILNDEVKNIPFTADDIVHLTQGETLAKSSSKEVPLDKLFELSPNARKSVDNALKQMETATAPTPTVKQTPDQLIAGARAKYSVQARKPEPPLPGLAEKAKVPTTPDGLRKLAGELLTPISSRLMRINPKLKEALRKFEYRVAQQTHIDSKQVLPLLNATKKLSKDDSVVFDLALKNGDEEVLQAVAKKYGFEDDLNEARLVLDDLYQRAKDVGIDVNYRKNYFPRIVKNPADYVAYWRGREDWSGIRQMVEEHAEKLGKKYTDLTDEEISGIVNNFLRGYGDKVQLATPNFAKGRTIDVIDDELNEFYVPSNEALSTYIIRMNDEIEGRKFFGKQLDEEGKPLAAGDSIGAYVMKQIQEGKIDPRREREVGDILKARFARGKMNGALDAYRHAEYISTMGSPISAITQIGDVAWSIYDNGIFHTAKGMFKKGGRITKEDLGIEQITQEFSNQTKLGKALQTVFKYTGMESLDRLGKETLVNAEFSKFKSLAQKNDPEMVNYLSKTFDPDEVPQVLKEFADGKLTENTKLVLFNKLLDFQPVAKSEMPQVYLEHPNGRLFYMLKSFTLKQYDIFRREAIDDITSGDKEKIKKGMKNLVLLAGSFTIANATADEIKDIILGRETPVEDRVVDNLWRLVGASKYDVYKARTDGVGQTVLKKILFPTSLADRAYKDVTNELEDKAYEKGSLKGEGFKLESTQSIPVGGKLYYWWFGRGAQKEEYKAGGSVDETTGLPKLPKLPTVEGGGLPQLPKLPKIGG